MIMTSRHLKIAALLLAAITLAADPIFTVLILSGSTSGTLTLRAAAIAGAGSTITLPAGTTDFSATGGASQVIRQTSHGAPFTVGQLAATEIAGINAGAATALGNAPNSSGGVTTFGTDLPVAGGTLNGELITAASATAGAGLNLPQGTAPTSPVNGDIWITSGGLFARVAGVTVGPLGTGGGGSPAFSAITSSTNTTAAMHVGSGATLDATGSGAITATAVPLGGVEGLGTNVGSGLANAATGSGAPVFAVSPAMTGTPTTPTASVGTNTTQIASTAFVQAQTVTDPICVTWDTTAGVTTQTVDFPVAWATYRITKMKTKTLGGGSFTASVQIGGVGVTGCSVAVSGATNTNTPCTGANTGIVDDIISVVMTSPSGTADQAYVCPVFSHTPN